MKLLPRILLLICCTIFSFIGANAQLVANFTATPTSGCAPLVVNFHNTTAPTSGTTYDWDLNNGSGILHLTDPAGSYLTAGTYTVTLTARNGSATSTHTQIITVYPVPIVSFVASDTSICPNTAVIFTSTTLAGVPGPVTYLWAFGDGYTSTLATPSHTYAASGFYNVTLTVTNAQGCASTVTVGGYMHVFDLPSVSFSASSSGYYCGTPGHAVFTSSIFGTGPYSYDWDFGDGSPHSYVPNPTHDYLSTGTYGVTLIVTDGNGCRDTLFRPGFIHVGGVTANFTTVTNACKYAIIPFSNTSSTHTGSQWYFGDGGSSTLDNPSWAYSASGTYTVTLIASNGPCHDTIRHVINIYPGPTGTFVITPDTPCPAPVTLNFNATVPSGCTVSWNYGDGSALGSGLTTAHMYGWRGVYNISMVITDPVTGCKDTVRQTKTLYDLVFTTTDSNISGCAPLRVHFYTNAVTHEPDTTATYTYPYPFRSYTWTWGDGTAAGSGPSPYHTYTAAGVYHAVVVAVTANGCIVTDTLEIRVGNPPVVTFDAAPLHLCYHNNSVTFTTTVIVGPVDEFDWFFGDGTTYSDSLPVISHHFILPGVFSATVIPYYNGCRGLPYVFTGTITIDSPKSVILTDVSCSPHTLVRFADSSLGDDSHVWLFGDGITSTLDNPTHTYPGTGSYTVLLATYNARSGCRDTSSQLLSLVNITATFDADRLNICRDGTVTFTPTVSGGTASAYFWYVNGAYVTSTALFTHVFTATGLYTIMLIIQDNNRCLDTFTRVNYIRVAKPVANFTVIPTSGCLPLNATFTDASNDVSGTTFTNFEWTISDGGYISGSSPSVTHLFTVAGTYTTREIVTDNIGCKDTITLPAVNVYHPTAAFNVANQFPCKYDPVTFNNTSVGASTSLWIFGDGGTSTLTTPVHTYTTNGIFTVKLVVTDTHGCRDTAAYVGYITVSKPTAGFFMSDSFSICPPLLVNFTNTSVGGLSYYWFLGDGTTSTAFSPSNLYIIPGIDTVKMIVTDMYGCVDTAIGHMVIYGYAGAFTYSPDSGCSPLTVHFNAQVRNVPNIIWDFADGTVSTVSVIDTIDHIYVLPGKYLPKLILSDNTGCQNSSVGIDTIKVDLVTPGYTTIPNPVCINGTTIFKDTSRSFYSTIDSWYWTFTNGDTSTSFSPSYTYTAIGTYSVTVVTTDGWGCQASITKDVIVYPLPVITASKDTIVCVGDAAVLEGYGGVSYTWAPPATLSCISCNPTNASPTTVTNYTVTGKDIHGCMNTDTVSVFLKTLTVSKAKGDTAICDGVVVKLFDSGGTKYTWLPATSLNSSNIADPLATPNVTTRYMAIAQLASCIPDTNYIMVTVYPLPEVDAGPDQWLVEGTAAQLHATGSNVYKYVWQNPGSLSCDSCSNPIARTDVNTTYFINVYSSYGCRNSDSVKLHVYCDKSQIFIPNSFTPNGDGQNDIFYPRGKGVSTINSFRIYNRWGELLFERSGININDASNGWDGSYKGSAPKPDVYVYIIDAQCETGEPLSFKGDVTIIR